MVTGHLHLSNRKDKFTVVSQSKNLFMCLNEIVIHLSYWQFRTVPPFPSLRHRGGSAILLGICWYSVARLPVHSWQSLQAAVCHCWGEAGGGALSLHQTHLISSCVCPILVNLTPQNKVKFNCLFAPSRWPWVVVLSRSGSLHTGQCRKNQL